MWVVTAGVSCRGNAGIRVGGGVPLSRGSTWAELGAGGGTVLPPGLRHQL